MPTNVVNPNMTSWSTFTSWILNSYPHGINTRVVQFDEWTEALSQSADNFVDPESNPAIKLFDFYGGVARVGKASRVLTSHEAEKISTTLQRGAVNEKWVRIWMRPWGFKPD